MVWGSNIYTVVPQAAIPTVVKVVYVCVCMCVCVCVLRRCVYVCCMSKCVFCFLCLFCAFHGMWECVAVMRDKNYSILDELGWNVGLWDLDHA